MRYLLSVCYTVLIVSLLMSSTAFAQWNDETLKVAENLPQDSTNMFVTMLNEHLAMEARNSRSDYAKHEVIEVISPHFVNPLPVALFLQGKRSADKAASFAIADYLGFNRFITLVSSPNEPTLFGSKGFVPPYIEQAKKNGLTDIRVSYTVDDPFVGYSEDTIKALHEAVTDEEHLLKIDTGSHTNIHSDELFKAELGPERETKPLLIPFHMPVEN